MNEWMKWMGEAPKWTPWDALYQEILLLSPKQWNMAGTPTTQLLIIILLPIWNIIKQNSPFGSGRDLMPTHSYLGVGGILCLLLYGSGRDLMPTFGKVPRGVRSLSLLRSSCKIPLFLYEEYSQIYGAFQILRKCVWALWVWGSRMHTMRRIMRIKPLLSLPHHKCNNKVNILIKHIQNCSVEHHVVKSIP